jgi:hypothetical protein
VNYGAYFMTSRYKVLSKYLKVGRHMSKRSFGFVRNGDISRLSSFYMTLHLPTLIRVLFSLLKFDRKFRIFRERCLSMSQKEAFEMDPYLSALHKSKGSKILHNLRVISLVHRYLDQLSNFMSFAYPGKTDGFEMMQWTSEMFLYKMHEFRIDIPKITRGFEDAIIKDTVVSLHTTNNVKTVRTEGTEFEAEFVVVATEPWATASLIGLGKEYNPEVSRSYMRHVIGIPKGIVSGKEQFIMFPSRSGMAFISKQVDGTYLVCSHSKEVSIDNFFSQYQIIFEKSWDPAFVSSSHELLEAKRGNGIFLAGGYNLEGMEDCAITGIYAARQIIKESKSSARIKP